MASPDVLNFERLLAPISAEQPTGAALREDFSPSSIYYKIKDARNTARAAERQSLYADDDDAASNAPRPDWNPVYALGCQILAEKSKDLEIAAWLTEALVRRAHYPGLRDGFRLIRELVEQYWDGIHPRPDEDGLVTTVAAITGLNGDQSEGALIKPVSSVPITEPGAHRAFTCGDYFQASKLEELSDPDKRQQRISEGAVSLQMIEQAVMETPRAFLKATLEDLQAACDEFDRMTTLLEEKCGKDSDGYPIAPPSSNLRQAMLDCLDVVRRFVKGEAGAPAEGEVLANGDRSLMTVGSDGGAANRKIQTRDDAFRALLMVADFFQRTEPHSPVSYALRQAVRWGQMPLPELLMELIPDAVVRDGLFRHVGIRVDEKQ